jgi:hypothetical protein
MRYKHSLNNDDAFDERGLLKDQHTYRVRLPLMDHDPTHRRRIVDAAGNDGLALNKPGYRLLQDDDAGRQAIADAHEKYLYDLENAWRGDAWRRGAGKEEIVPDAPKASRSDAMPVDDIETAYRLYAEEISQAWKTPR